MHGIIKRTLIAVSLAGFLSACRQGPEPGPAIQFSRVDSGPHVSDTSSSPSASWVDLDSDGDEDLYVLNGYGSLEDPPAPQRDRLYLNDGRGRFTEVPNHPLVDHVTYSGSSTWGDYDNDGDLDVFVANQREADNVLFRNDGAGGFSRVPAGDFGQEIAFVSSVSAADPDNDGDLDLYLTQWPINDAGGASNTYFRNDTEGANGLKVDLEGTKSNRSAIGAKIIVTATAEGAEKKQLRYVTSRSSWRSASSLTQHFGLGDAVDEIEVRWPSGHVDTLPGPIEANRRLRILEAARSQAVPNARSHHQLVYHGGERKAYLIGGSTRSGKSYHYFDDMWSWSDSGWARVDTLPFLRSSHRVVYHPGRNSLILFGGGAHRSFGQDGALWEWRGREWSKLGEHPGAGRAEPGMCYDRKRDRVVIFGGWDEESELSRTTWEWAGGELLEVDTAGPSARAGHAFLFDPTLERCLLIGGGDGTAIHSDTWKWDGSDWRRLDVSGPTPRWFFGTAVDEARNRIVLFGGTGPEGDYSDTWTWDGARWERISTEGPSARGMPRLAFDGENVILFGGRERTEGGWVDHNDTWVLSDRTWIRRQ